MTNKVVFNDSDDYTVVLNSAIQNSALSHQAIGLYVHMLSLPSDFDFSLNGLTELSKEGVKSVRSMLKELESFGYINRTRMHGDNGKFYYKYEINYKPEVKDKKELGVMKNEKRY